MRRADRYNMRMAKKPTYNRPPAGPQNQWVRDALAFAGMSYPKAAEALTMAGLGAYDRSKVQKMTVDRKVTKEEAEALAAATGYPVAAGASTAAFVIKYQELTGEDRELVDQFVDRLLNKSAQEGSSS